MTVVAAIRPDDVNLVLFLHVAGAMLLVGGLLAAAGALAFAGGEARVTRLGFMSVFALALPGWILMRVFGQITYSDAGWEELAETVDDPTWLTIGYIVGDASALLLLISLVLSGIGVRRLRDGRGSTLARITLVLVVIMLVAFLVAAWAMSAKPD